VQNGKLTSDQAEELKNVFAKRFRMVARCRRGRKRSRWVQRPGRAGRIRVMRAPSSSSSDQLNQILSDFLKSVQQNRCPRTRPTMQAATRAACRSRALVMNTRLDGCASALSSWSTPDMIEMSPARRLSLLPSPRKRGEGASMSAADHCVFARGSGNLTPSWSR